MDISELENALDNLREDELDRALTEKKEELKNAPPKSAEDMRKESAKGHRGRVKERFLVSGLDGFAPHEILELLLFYVIPYKDQDGNVNSYLVGKRIHIYAIKRNTSQRHKRLYKYFAVGYRVVNNEQ